MATTTTIKSRGAHLTISKRFKQCEWSEPFQLVWVQKWKRDRINNGAFESSVKLESANGVIHRKCDERFDRMPKIENHWKRNCLLIPLSNASGSFGWRKKKRKCHMWATIKMRYTWFWNSRTNERTCAYVYVISCLQKSIYVVYRWVAIRCGQNAWVICHFFRSLAIQLCWLCTVSIIVI